MNSFTPKNNNLEAAKLFDQNDKLRSYREKFIFPKHKNGEDLLYFAGHSLGLMPKQTKDYIEEELIAWQTKGVGGHFEGERPWIPYHESITSSFAKLMGARDSEVVAMNTLTVNLHLMLVSFYRPTKKKYKILIENNTFPSDKYAVDSQARFHGFDPKDAVIELKPSAGKMTVTKEQIEEQIREHGDELALIMLGNCNYLSGQCFDMEEISKLGHEYGAFVGFNLAHGAGNLELKLHDWNVDFAVFCTYKYMNSGPGGIAGSFVHENHLGKVDIPRFEGWWGHNKKERFKMGPDFNPIPTAEAWQLSNAPILLLATLRSSMQIYDEAGLENIINKRNHLTSYMEWLLQTNCSGFVEIQTPGFEQGKQTRGAMLSVKMKIDGSQLVNTFKDEGLIVDFREPDILRMAPVPLYNSYEDVFKLVDTIKRVANNSI